MKPSPTDVISVPSVAFSALCQWILQVGGMMHAEQALLGRRGCAPEEASLLMQECERLREDFQTRANAPFMGGGRIEEAYRELGLQTLSSWEQSEEEVQEGMASGRYKQALEAPELLEFSPLIQLVIHGGFELARPLLLRFARERDPSIDALWAQWVATNELDLAWARRLAGPPSRMKDGTYGRDADLALFFLEGDAVRAREALAFATSPKERALSDKPVQSLPRLFAQLLAFWEGQFPREVLVKSFGLWFGASQEPYGPLSVLDKLGPAYLYGRFLEPLPAHVLVERIKTHLPMFSPQRRRARASKVAQVRPVMEALEAVMAPLSRGEGLSVVASEDSQRMLLGPWSEQPEEDEDFF